MSGLDNWSASRRWMRLTGRRAALLAVAWCVLSLGYGLAWAQQPAGWSEATHDSGSEPSYDGLFAANRVHELRLTIAPENFSTMQADLAEVTARGFGGRRGGGRGGGFDFAAIMEQSVQACADAVATDACSVDGMDGQCTNMAGQLGCIPEAIAAGFRGNGAPNLISRDPIYVPVTVRHEGREWPLVGMRYKGNSSLASSRGNGKVPFRLDFDRYEDDAPETLNQRFYGFQRMTFSSNFSDDSQIREVLASEILRDRGVPVARTAFYRVYVDVGAGDEYWGLYTMVEDPADGAMLDAQFGTRDGNLYKPDGPGADWTGFVEEGFVKKSNEDEADFTDVEAAVEALHAPMDAPASWRQALEREFNVDGFLRWLAVNTALESWDAYGAMAHNYYLYSVPADGGRLNWIPWDHNMSFGFNLRGGRGGQAFGRGRPAAPASPQTPASPETAVAPNSPQAPQNPQVRRGGRGGGFGRGTAGPDVLHLQMGEQWPLISRVLADAVYRDRYRELLAEAIQGAFAVDAFAERARQLHTLVAPWVVGSDGERTSHTTISSPEAFETSVEGPSGLVDVVERRHATIRATLAGADVR